MNRLIDLEQKQARYKHRTHTNEYATQKGELLFADKSLTPNTINAVVKKLNNWSSTGDPYRLPSGQRDKNEAPFLTLINELNSELSSAESKHDIQKDTHTFHRTYRILSGTRQYPHPPHYRYWLIQYANTPLIFLDCRFKYENNGIIDYTGPIWVTINGPDNNRMNEFTSRFQTLVGFSNRYDQNNLRSIHAGQKVNIRPPQRPPLQQRSRPQQPQNQILQSTQPPPQQRGMAPPTYQPVYHPPSGQTGQKGSANNQQTQLRQPSRTATIYLKNNKYQPTSESRIVEITPYNKPIAQAERVSNTYLKFNKAKNKNLSTSEKRLRQNSSAYKMAANTNQSIRELVVNLHNYYRRLHGTNLIEWDEVLASTAQNFAWAQSKAYPRKLGEHTTPYNVGENIYWNARQGLTKNEAIVDAISTWYNEIGWYDFSTGKKGTFKGITTKKVGHFTQLIWHGTTKVGCGAEKTSNGEWHVYCHYTPAGMDPPYHQWINYVPLPLKTILT